jgi:hypothetical protein
MRSSSTSRQRIQPTTPIAPPIAPPYHTSPEPENAEQRRERDLIGPVDRLAELAQPSRDDQATGDEAERERHAERLDRDAEEVDFGLHGVDSAGILFGVAL